MPGGMGGEETKRQGQVLKYNFLLLSGSRSQSLNLIRIYSFFPDYPGDIKLLEKANSASQSYACLISAPFG